MKENIDASITHSGNVPIPIIKQSSIEDLMLDHQPPTLTLDSFYNNLDDDDGFEDELIDHFHDKMKMKIEDVNAQFAADPTPIESDRLRFVTFKDKLVDVAPTSPPDSPNFLQDIEINEKSLKEIQTALENVNDEINNDEEENNEDEDDFTFQPTENDYTNHQIIVANKNKDSQLNEYNVNNANNLELYDAAMNDTNNTQHYDDDDDDDNAKVLQIYKDEDDDDIYTNTDIQLCDENKHLSLNVINKSDKEELIADELQLYDNITEHNVIKYNSKVLNDDNLDINFSEDAYEDNHLSEDSSTYTEIEICSKNVNSNIINNSICNEMNSNEDPLLNNSKTNSVNGNSINNLEVSLNSSQLTESIVNGNSINNLEVSLNSSQLMENIENKQNIENIDNIENNFENPENSIKIENKFDETANHLVQNDNTYLKTNISNENENNLINKLANNNYEHQHENIEIKNKHDDQAINVQNNTDKDLNINTDISNENIDDVANKIYDNSELQNINEENKSIQEVNDTVQNNDSNNFKTSNEISNETFLKSCNKQNKSIISNISQSNVKSISTKSNNVTLKSKQLSNLKKNNSNQFLKKLPDYKGNPRSQYGLSNTEYDELKHEIKRKSTQKRMKEKELKETITLKREQSNQAFEAWLKRKKTEEKIKNSEKIEKSTCFNEQSKKEQNESEKAFQLWLKKKEDELYKNQILEQLHEEELAMKHHKVSRGEANRAFRRWLKEKKKEQTGSRPMSSQHANYLNTVPISSRQVKEFAQIFHTYLGSTL